MDEGSGAVPHIVGAVEPHTIQGRRQEAQARAHTLINGVGAGGVSSQAEA